MANRQKAVLLLIMAAFFWSTSGVLIKIVSMPPLFIAGWRSFVAAWVIWVICRKEIRISFNPENLAAAGCMGLFCVCFVLSTKLSTAANAIVLQYSAIAYVAVLAPVLLNEPTRRSDWCYLAVIVLGICFFFMDDLSVQGRWGIGIGIVGSMFWALATIFLRKSRNHSTAWPLVLSNFIAAAICMPFMFSHTPNQTDVFGILGMGVVSIGAGYAVYSYAIKKVHALDAVLICSIEPVINPLWVFLFTGEIPGPVSLFGCALVLAATTFRGFSSVLFKSKDMEVRCTDGY